MTECIDLITLLVCLLHWNASRVRCISFAIIFLPSSTVSSPWQDSRCFWRKEKKVRRVEGSRQIERKKKFFKFYYSTCSQYLICEGHPWTTILGHNPRLLAFTIDSVTICFLQIGSHFCEVVGWIQWSTFIIQIDLSRDLHLPTPNGQEHYAVTNRTNQPTLKSLFITFMESANSQVNSVNWEVNECLFYIQHCTKHSNNTKWICLKNLEHALKNVCLAKKIKLNKVQEVIVEKYCATKMLLNSHIRVV